MDFEMTLILGLYATFLAYSLIINRIFKRRLRRR